MREFVKREWMLLLATILLITQCFFLDSDLPRIVMAVWSGGVAGLAILQVFADRARIAKGSR